MEAAIEQEVKHGIMPLPWEANIGDSLSDDNDCWVIDCEQGSIAEMQCPADVEEATARFIVRAVNNHDALIQALEVLRSTLRPVLRDHEVRGNVDRTEGYVLVALNQIDAALAAVRQPDSTND